MMTFAVIGLTLFGVFAVVMLTVGLLMVAQDLTSRSWPGLRLYRRMLAEDGSTLRAILRVMVARWRAVRRLRALARRGGGTDAS